jgi:hypothetical protein
MKDSLVFRNGLCDLFRNYQHARDVSSHVLLGSVVFQLADSFIVKDSLVFRNGLCASYEIIRGMLATFIPYS